MGIIPMPIRWAAIVMVFAPTFIPYDAQTTSLSLSEKPCDTKLRSYFSAYRFQSSHVRKNPLGVPLVPLVSWMENTLFQSVERNSNSVVTGGWCCRIVFPEITGKLRRSSCILTFAGSILFSRKQLR